MSKRGSVVLYYTIYNVLHGIKAKNEEEIREIRINKKWMRIEWKKNEWEMSEEILKARSERKNEWEISERWTNEGIITEWKKAWMRHK